MYITLFLSEKFPGTFPYMHWYVPLVYGVYVVHRRTASLRAALCRAPNVLCFQSTFENIQTVPPKSSLPLSLSFSLAFSLSLSFSLSISIYLCQQIKLCETLTVLKRIRQCVSCWWPPDLKIVLNTVLCENRKRSHTGYSRIRAHTVPRVVLCS